MKLNLLILATLAGMQLVFPAWAADDTATNSTGAAQAEIPAQTASGGATQSVEAAEIEALKKAVQELEPKSPGARTSARLGPADQHCTAVEQIQDLDQKVRILGRQRELDQESATAAAKAQPRITVGANGFSFGSADSNFVVALHGVIQVDSRTFEQNDKVQGNDSILLRRARPILSGTVYRDFDFLFVPEFGGGTPGASSSATTPSIYDAYVNYRYSPAFQIPGGQIQGAGRAGAIAGGRQHLFQ